MPIPYSIRKKEGNAYMNEKKNAGYSLLAAAALLGASKLTNKVSRRNFLKGAGVSTLALAGSLGLPWFTRQVAWLAENVGSPATTTLYDIGARLQEDRGYMDFMLGLRNLVIAHKIHTVIDVLKRDYGIEKPVASSFYGAFHGRGLKEALEMPAEKRWKPIEELVELAKAGAAEDDKIDAPMPYSDHVFKVPELRRKESGEGWDTRMIEMGRQNS